MITRHFRKIAILAAILAIFLAACGPQETETPEPTEEVVEATAEAVEATEEMTEEAVEATEEMTEEAVEATEEMTEEAMDMEATEEAVEATEEVVEATEEAMDMEATEEAMDMEATEEAMDMEATEEAMDMEATEEAMDMEATEEPMDDMDMSDGAVVTYDDEAGFTFDYPEGYEPTVNADGSVISLAMGEQRLIVVSPTGWSNVVIGEQEGSLDEQLAFFVERLGYTAGESSDMMMSDASINVEVPRRGLVGYANLSDLDNGNYAVVIELGPDADSIPGADGAVISGSMVMEVVQAEPIAVGDTIAASISAGQRSSYELTLADGETVNIYLNGLDGLDTYLRVYDADGILIAENDDLNGVSSGLEAFSVAGGGIVTVEVGTYADGEAGDYELVVEVAAAEEVEATEEPMEATEEPMGDAEATEEPMDMEATEEAAADDMDMSDGAVVTYDDEAGFTFDYPEGYEPTVNADGSVISLDMGEQRLIVVSPTGWSNVVIGEQEGSLDEQLAFFVERLGYTAGESSDMMMSDASINVEVPRRGLVGYANLSDLDNGNYAVVIELGPDADSIPGADGAVISGSMVMEVVQAEPVAVGDTIAASIDAGQRSSYELTLADGETVNIYLNGLDGLDTYLRVYDADGILIAENDDLNGVSSGLEAFSVAGGGVVTVEVGTFGDGEAGDYELVVEVAASEEAADDEEAMDMEESSLTIVGLALQNENLSTLLVAIQRGGYLPTLNGEGSFTVFAPGNEAFEAALESLGLTADELLADEELLSSVLTYHVVEGAVMSGDLEDGAEITTLNGAVLTVGVSDEGVTLTDGQGNTYNVVTADVAASNGVVHIIDGVLMPASE